ncbi:hypothetical protein DTL42_01420, partial [Bremerella cremea]
SRDLLVHSSWSVLGSGWLMLVIKSIPEPELALKFAQYLGRYPLLRIFILRKTNSKFGYFSPHKTNGVAFKDLIHQLLNAVNCQGRCRRTEMLIACQLRRLG